jgi:dCMP deaminase
MSWDNRWMDMAKLVAGWSKDRSRSCGAVIVDSRNVLVSIGWNGFPRGINDDVDVRHERPAKYLWTEHAERNAIFNAAANGHPTKDCVMYLPWYPCADCARAIIQSGISEIICIEPDWDDHAGGFSLSDKNKYSCRCCSAYRTRANGV